MVFKLYSGHEIASKGNNSKNTQARVMVLVHDTLSRHGLQVYQVSLTNLKRKRFSSYRADTICDGRMDRRTDIRTG